MKLKHYLQKKQMTYQQFAELVGVKRMTVYAWCADNHRHKTPRPKHLLKIRQITGGKVSYRDFYDE